MYTCQILKTLLLPRYYHDPLLCFANAKDKAKPSQASLVDTHNLRTLKKRFLKLRLKKEGRT